MPLGLLLVLLLMGLPWASSAAPSATTVDVVTATDPTDIVHAGDGRLFIVEQGGQIRMLPEGGGPLATFLDLSSLVSGGFERGLFSLAFHPAHAQNGLFYVSYTDSLGDSVVAEYSVSSDPDVADPNSAAIIFGPISQPSGNHNGGRLQFDQAGSLYLGLGDGGGSGDPSCLAQRDDTLLGKLLRIDVDANPVTFEVVAKGLRNPWRFSFDRATGDLYIGDVGQGSEEEIDFHPAGTPPGRNYGWKVMEGTLCFDPDPIDADCPPQTPSCFDPAYTEPVTSYANAGPDCSVTGGYVYRGRKQEPYGLYFYGDFCSGSVWVLDPAGWTNQTLLDGGSQLRSFGEDVDGELYAAFGNQIVRFEFAGPDRPPVPIAPHPWLLLLGLGLLVTLGLGQRRAAGAAARRRGSARGGVALAASARARGVRSPPTPWRAGAACD